MSSSCVVATESRTSPSPRMTRSSPYGHRPSGPDSKAEVERYREFTNVLLPPKTNEEMIIFIKNLSDDKIIGSAPKEDMNFISQLKINATTKLDEQWAQRWSGEMSPELFTESEVQPPRFSSMSPMHENLSQTKVVDDECGIDEFLTQINPTQVTWAPTKSLPTSLPSFDCLDNTADEFDSDNFAQYPPWYNNRVIHSPSTIAVDENDSPTSFNKSPSILGSKPTKKRSAKRKLFFE